MQLNETKLHLCDKTWAFLCDHASHFSGTVCPQGYLKSVQVPPAQSYQQRPGRESRLPHTWLPLMAMAKAPLLTLHLPKSHFVDGA